MKKKLEVNEDITLDWELICSSGHGSTHTATREEETGRKEIQGQPGQKVMRLYHNRAWQFTSVIPAVSKV
jgi:hypothetical protein